MPGILRVQKFPTRRKPVKSPTNLRPAPIKFRHLPRHSPIPDRRSFGRDTPLAFPTPEPSDRTSADDRAASTPTNINSESRDRADMETPAQIAGRNSNPLTPARPARPHDYPSHSTAPPLAADEHDNRESDVTAQTTANPRRVRFNDEHTVLPSKTTSPANTLPPPQRREYHSSALRKIATPDTTTRRSGRTRTPSAKLRDENNATSPQAQPPPIPEGGWG